MHTYTPTRRDASEYVIRVSRIPIQRLPCILRVSRFPFSHGVAVEIAGNHQSFVKEPRWICINLLASSNGNALQQRSPSDLPIFFPIFEQITVTLAYRALPA